MARSDDPKGPYHLLVQCPGLFQHAFAEQSCGFGYLNVIQQGQGLQRRARALAADDADIPLSGVECQHCWRRDGAFPKSVEAAAMEVVPMALLVFGIAHRDLPEAGRLIRFDARPANFFGEKSTRGESLIAEHLGGEAARRGASEEFVFRIA